MLVNGGVAHAGPLVTVGANFAGPNFTTKAEANIDVVTTPPDTDGAIGPTAFVELLNSGYWVYSRSGAIIQALAPGTFWLNAGVTPKAGVPVDPRVVYDPTSQRWFAASGDNAFVPNDILLAVSNTPDPTQGWKAVAFPSDPTGQTWADFDRLGVNKDGVFIATNMYLTGTPQPQFSSEKVIAIPKADLLRSSPTAANATIFDNVNSGDTGFSPYPAVAFDLSGSEPLFAAYSTANLKISSLDGPITSPTLNTSEPVLSVTELNPANAVQKGTTVRLNTNDNRFSSNVVLQNGKLFGVNTISDRATPGANAVLQWYVIGDPLTGPALLDSGIIHLADLDVIYGSIAINPQGQVLIGFTGSGPNDYPSAYAIAGTLSDNTLTLGDLILLKAGDGPYLGTPAESGFPVVRWGDYSATTVDPNDFSHFWTTQEWAASDGSGGVIWSTEISEIIFGTQVAVPEPSSLLVLGMGLVGLALLKGRLVLTNVRRAAGTLSPARRVRF